MSATLSGSLKAFPAEPILRFLEACGATGTLRVTARQVEIVFRSGALVFARRGTAPSASTAEFTKRDLELALIDLFQAADATFEFDDAAVAPETAMPITVDLAAIRQEAAATDQRRLEAHDLFARPEAVAYVVSTPETSQISIDAEAFRMLMRIGAGKLVKDVVRESGGDPASVYEQLHRLREQKLIGVRLPEQQLEVQEAAPAESEGGIGCLTLEDEARTSFPLFDEVYTIGRDAGSTILIQDGSVSGTHARIVRAPSGYAIEDLGSRNGTFVNGKQVSRELLKDNDSIRLGKVYLIFNIADDDLNQTQENRKSTNPR